MYDFVLRYSRFIYFLFLLLSNLYVSTISSSIPSLFCLICSMLKKFYIIHVSISTKLVNRKNSMMMIIVIMIVYVYPFARIPTQEPPSSSLYSLSPVKLSSQ